MRNPGKPFVSFLLVLSFTAAALAGENAVPPAGEGPAAGLVLEISGARKVVEPGETIEVKYALANRGERTATVVRSTESERVTVPLTWAVTRGESTVETRQGAPGPVVTIPGVTAKGPLAIFGGRTFDPAEAESSSPVAVKARYSVTAEMYGEHADDPGAFIGELESNVLEFELRPAGWREAVYRRYVTHLDALLRAKFSENSLEFPEARKLGPVDISATAENAAARMKMDVERLVVNSEEKTARLRTIPGTFSVTAADPWAARPAAPMAGELLEDGLVYVWCEVKTGNKWWNAKCAELCAEALKDLKENGLPPEKEAEGEAAAEPAPPAESQ